MKKCAAVFGLLVSMIAGVPATAAAQLSSGNLYMTVTTDDGQGVPGATVTVDGPGAPRVTVSSANGLARFLGLPVGTYTMTVALEGFATTTRQVRVRAGRSVSQRSVLQLSTNQEELVVAAQSPVMDNRSGTTTGIFTSSEDLERLPVAPNALDVLTLVPGVLTDRVPGGGHDTGLTQSLTRGGGGIDQNHYYFDGVDITDMGSLGIAPTFYDFQPFESIEVVTGGSDATLPTAGAVINVVTKSGGNEFSGSFEYYAHGGSVFSALDPDPIAPDAIHQQDLDSLDAFSATLGGPIVKDRIWFFVSGGSQDVSRFGVSAGQATATDYSYQGLTGKVDARVSPSNTISGYTSIGRVERLGDGASPDRQPATTWSQTGPTDIYKLEDTHAFNSDFILTSRLTRFSGGFERTPASGSAVAIQDLFAQTLRGGFYGAESDRATTQFQTDGSYFLAGGALDHEFKFGFQYRTASQESRYFWPAGTLTVIDDPFFEPIAVFPPTTNLAIEMDYLSAYAQDTLTWGRLSVNVGMRFDVQSGRNGASIIESNPLRPLDVPGGTFDGADSTFEWESITPRVGLTYDVAGNGKTLLRASYARFADQLGSGSIGLTNPIAAEGPLLGSQAFRFLDLNDNNRYDDGEPNGQSSILGGVTADQAGYYDSADVVDPDLSSPYTDEFTFGVDREVVANVLLGATFVYRKQSNLLAELPLIDDPFDGTRTITPNDFVPGAPIQGTGADGEPFDVETFRLAEPRQYTGGVFLTNQEDYATEYVGLELSVQKRFSDRWSLAGSLTLQDWTWTVPDALVKDANDLLGSFDNDGAPVAPASQGAFKSVFLNSRWQANLTAAYALPFGIEVGSHVSLRQGYPTPQFVTGDPGDGRVRQIQVGALDDRRLDDIFLVDMRVRKTFDVQNFKADVFMDLRNLTGDQTVLQRRGDLSAPGAGQAIEFVDPRRYFLGARLRF